MKKLIFLFAILATTLMTSCKKDPVSSNPETLNNTTWKCTLPYSDDVDEGTITGICEFADHTFSITVILTITGEGGYTYTDVERGSYVYTDPLATLSINDPIEYIMSGIVDGDKLTFDDEDMMGAIFIRQ